MTQTEVAVLPIHTKFKLGAEITPEQQAFLTHYGFLHFPGVATPEEVEMLRSEHDRLERMWLEKGEKSLNGIPFFFGRNENEEPVIHRIPFCSRYSEGISRFVKDERFDPVRRLIGEDARVGEHEKDGVVINRYLNTPGSLHSRQGWHTDGLRDLFYLRMPVQMLNVGMHLDDINAEDGGLRIIPRTHDQSFWAMCSRKIYFLSHAPDPEEIVIETKAGDLTVHDGRLWHRAAQSSKTGQASLRRAMYVPYLTGPYEPKDERSKTPGYHTLGKAIRAVRTFGYAMSRRLKFLPPGPKVA